jgi:hypothetical protein
MRKTAVIAELSHCSESLAALACFDMAEFLAPNLNVGGCLDSNANGSARDAHNCHNNITVDNQTLSFLARQH